MTPGEDLRTATPPPLRDDDHVRGDAHKPLIVFYADFTCPRCALAHERLVDAGARVAFRHFALRAKHPRAIAVALAAEAAGAQDAFWPFADALYADQGRLDDPHLWQRARDLGLDLAGFDEHRRADAAATRVREDTRAALAAGATTTPTIFAGDSAYSGVPDGDWLARVGYDRAPSLEQPSPPDPQAAAR
ncbi:MAG: DsbA family protein [Actinobacteria bacterium]|nr:DsbA family protein [Actinomycetota bacterium]